MAWFGRELEQRKKTTSPNPHPCGFRDDSRGGFQGDWSPVVQSLDLEWCMVSPPSTQLRHQEFQQPRHQSRWQHRSLTTQLPQRVLPLAQWGEPLSQQQHQKAHQH